MDSPAQPQTTTPSAPVQPTRTPAPTTSTPPASTPKSPINKGLWAAIIIVILVVAGVGTYAFMSKQRTMTQGTTAMTDKTMQKPSESPQQSPSPTMTTQATGLSNGNTDANLDQDAATLDKGLNSTNAELNSADQGLNDQPADLSQ